MDWHILRQKVDQLVDYQFAGPVSLYPWHGGTVSTPGSADPSRSPVDTTAILVTPGAKIIGESGAAMAGGFSTKILASDVWISIDQDNLGDPAGWHAHDRVRWEGKWYEIDYIDPSATFRPQIHLIRIQDGVMPQMLYAASIVASPTLDAPGLS